MLSRTLSAFLASPAIDLNTGLAVSVAVIFTVNVSDTLSSS